MLFAGGWHPLPESVCIEVFLWCLWCSYGVCFCVFFVVLWVLGGFLYVCVWFSRCFSVFHAVYSVYQCVHLSVNTNNHPYTHPRTCTHPHPYTPNPLPTPNLNYVRHTCCDHLNRHVPCASGAPAGDAIPLAPGVACNVSMMLMMVVSSAPRSRASTNRSRGGWSLMSTKMVPCMVGVWYVLIWCAFGEYGECFCSVCVWCLVFECHPGRCCALLLAMFTLCIITTIIATIIIIPTTIITTTATIMTTPCFHG